MRRTKSVDLVGIVSFVATSVLLFLLLLLSTSDAADDNAVGWFEVSMPVDSQAASCAAAGAGSVGSNATLPENLAPATVQANGSMCRGAAECAARCWNEPQCSGFTFDARQQVCNAFTNTGSTSACNRSNNLYKKPCGLKSAKLTNTIACASRLLAPLPDSAFSATSVNNGKAPKCAKLYNAFDDCAGYYGAWSPFTSTNDSDYMQIDLPMRTTITGYDIKARLYGPGYEYTHWVTTFSISYSCDGQSFMSYAYNGSRTIFQGNSNVNSTFSTTLDYVIAGVRSIRIQPISFNVGKSLRIELYGC